MNCVFLRVTVNMNMQRVTHRRYPNFEAGRICVNHRISKESQHTKAILNYAENVMRMESLGKNIVVLPDKSSNELDWETFKFPISQTENFRSWLVFHCSHLSSL